MSETPGPAAPPPCRAFDPAAWAYMIGVRALAAYGVGDRAARPIIGRWLRRITAEALVPILIRAATRERGSLVEYVERALKGEGDAGASAGAAAPPAATRTADEKFAARVRGLTRAGMLHLLTPDDQLRAAKAGLLPASAPTTAANPLFPLSSALKRSQDTLGTAAPAAVAPGASLPPGGRR